MRKKSTKQTKLQEMILNEKTPSYVLEAYREMRTNILYLPISARCRKLAFTSACAKEGKTVTSINIAICLVQLGKKVLLIDADIRASLVSRYLDLKKTNGLNEYLLLMDDEPNVLTDIPAAKGVDVLLAGTLSSNPGDLMMSERMKKMIDVFSLKYDYIIFDTPPVNVVNDATTLLGLVDGYIFVVRSDYSDINDVKESIEKFSKLDANVYGFVLNDEKERRGNYGRYKNDQYDNYYGGYGD
ncbi:MAG: CpsD/CapB family tyrosine-protein kinase [Oscillospiraceae bacterium]|nr:CpsD/CapB family tyrosine-protein kinase [Oscillospiraceae bacterium]